ncbi:MAG: protein kinase [Acidobacteriota bacterium]|nr:protein kinase [Acidobacteriota bacterium]
MLSCPKCGRRYGGGLRHCPEEGTPLRADDTVIGFSACDPMVGQVLDEKYRLDEWLGEGGMGTVYRATHLLIDRPVAVKVLHARFVEDEAAQQRFRREARAAGRLQHPNAVAVTDFGRTTEGCVYIVMELLEGRTLREALAQESPLSTVRAVDLMTQAAGAVEAAHDAGVIHRDLKPANIFVVQRKGAQPVVKVLDFGIAKLAADSLDDSDAKNLTQTGVMIGTPRYMSPEQCDGEHLTPASDVYSLGIILYEMLTGETPFNGASPLAVALQHSSKQPRPPREIVQSIPEELERVVLHALAKKPEERPANAGEFRDELIATARRLGLAPHDPVFAQPRTTAFGGNGANANGDGNGKQGVAEAKTTSGRLVIDLDPSARGAGPLAPARSGETTVLAEPPARRDTAEQRRSTGSIPVAATAAELVPAPVRAFTRLQILMREQRTPLAMLRRPPVLISVVLALFVFAAVAASVIHSRRAAGANVGNAAATVIPSPTAEVAAQPSPTAGEAPADNRAAKGERDREERRPARASRAARRPPKSNAVVRTLKKIFKNPF